MKTINNYINDNRSSYEVNIDEVASDPKVAFMDRVIPSAEFKKWRDMPYKELQRLGMNELAGCIDYGVKEIKKLASDIDEEEVARIIFRIYYAAQNNVDKGNRNDFARW